MTAPTLDEMVNAVVDAMQGPPLPVRERLRLESQGFSIVEPGTFGLSARWGFTLADWLPDSFLAAKDGVVAISLIAARRPGSGAFSRLVKRIEADGWRTEVVCPLPRMQAILKRWGFVVRHVGSTFDDRVDIWSRP